MTATAPPEQVAILGQVKHVSGQVRIIARDGDGRYAIGTLDRRAHDAADTFKPITPWVTFGDVARTADNIVAGDARATTWPHALLTLALGILALRCEFELPSSGDPLAAEPVPNPIPPPPEHRAAAADEAPASGPRASVTASSPDAGAEPSLPAGR